VLFYHNNFMGERKEKNKGEGKKVPSRPSRADQTKKEKEPPDHLAFQWEKGKATPKEKPPCTNGRRGGGEKEMGTVF